MILGGMCQESHPGRANVGSNDRENGVPKQLVLTIGLPSSGKSTMCRRMLCDGDALFEFDEFFYTQVGSDPESYDWARSLMPEAREWNFNRISAAIDAGVPRIIVDSDNQAHAFTRSYVKYAVDRGYAVVFREPDTPWWREISRLLRDKNANAEQLERWVEKLYMLSRGTHRVGQSTFRRRMKRWIPDISVADILAAPPSRQTVTS